MAYIENIYFNGNAFRMLAKGADGQLHNVTGANLNANGNFVNSNGQVMKDSQGNAITSSGMAVTAAMGANGATNISSAVEEYYRF